MNKRSDFAIKEWSKSLRKYFTIFHKKLSLGTKELLSFIQQREIPEILKKKI